MGIAAAVLAVLGGALGVVIATSGSDFGGPPLEAITVHAPEDLPATPQQMDGAPAVPVPPAGSPTHSRRVHSQPSTAGGDGRCAGPAARDQPR